MNALAQADAVADLGLMKGGFSGDAMVLDRGAHSGKWGGRTQSAQSRGVWGHAPSRKFWISDLLRSFLVQTGSNHDRYSHGIYLNIDG